jgi:hypothetical protein
MALLSLAMSMGHVALARPLVRDRGLDNVEVLQADGRATGRPSAWFGVVQARLLLINIPSPEQVVAEMVRLVKPGGWVIVLEADAATQICYPPRAGWDRLTRIFGAGYYTEGAARPAWWLRRFHQSTRDLPVCSMGYAGYGRYWRHGSGPGGEGVAQPHSDWPFAAGSAPGPRRDQRGVWYQPHSGEGGTSGAVLRGTGRRHSSHRYHRPGDASSGRNHNFAVLATLAGKTAEWAAERITPEELANLRRLAEATITEDDVVAANWRFHRAVNVASRSPRLLTFLRQAERVVPGNYFELFPQQEQHSISEHSALVDAIEARNSSAARAIAEAHVLDVGRALGAWLVATATEQAATESEAAALASNSF